MMCCDSEYDATMLLLRNTRDQRREYQRVGDRFGRGQGAGAVRRRLVHGEISTTVRDRDGHGRGDVSHRRVVVSSEWP